MNFKELITEISRKKSVVISDHRSSLTGVELALKVHHLSIEFMNQGFGNHKTVLLRMSNNIDSIIAFFALVLSKNVVFVANPHEPIKKYFNNVKRFKPYALVSNKPSALAVAKRNNKNSFQYDFRNVSLSANIFLENEQSLDSYDARMKDVDVAIFSSGSTGKPKAILHSMENLLNNAKLHVEAVGLNKTDIVGVALPLYYSYGLVANLLGSFVAKARISLHQQVGVVDCDWINQENITFIGLTPYFSKNLKQPLKKLRVITLGGDILYRTNALQLMELFPNCLFFSTYGLTEAGPRVATWKFDKNTLENNSLNSSEIVPLGNPLRGVEFSLKDDFGKNSLSGELVIKTPTRMKGYYHGVYDGYDMPESNINEVHTDDLFELKDGELYFVGRKKHVIVQGGEKLFPIALESVIRKIDGVIDAKVGSVSDINKGQIAKAYIVAENSVSVASIHKILLGHFTRSLIPAKLELVDTINRTLTGKVA